MNIPKINLLSVCFLLLILLTGCSFVTKPETIDNESGADNNCFVQVYSNPLPKGETAIFTFPLDASESNKLVITNVLEQEVISMVVTESPLVWNGKDKYGQQCENGVYYYTLYLGEEIISRKLLLII